MGLGPPVCTACRCVCVHDTSRLPKPWYCPMCGKEGDSNAFLLSREDQAKYLHRTEWLTDKKGSST